MVGSKNTDLDGATYSDTEYTNGLNKKYRNKQRIFYYIALLLMFVLAG